MEEESLKQKILSFIEMELRSCSMEVITSDYIYRMWGGEVPLEEIEPALKEIQEDRS